MNLIRPAQADSVLIEAGTIINSSIFYVKVLKYFGDTNEKEVNLDEEVTAYSS